MHVGARTEVVFGNGDVIVAAKGFHRVEGEKSDARGSEVIIEKVSRSTPGNLATGADKVNAPIEWQRCGMN
jgi:hypothetical protein